MTTRNNVNNNLSGRTGTGNFVGASSPTIITPVIAQINDANGNAELSLTATASAVNYSNIANAAAGDSPIISAKGSDTNIILSTAGKGNGGCILQRTQTNTSAAAGYTGEYIASNIGIGSAVNLVDNTGVSITSISLTAGDWDVRGAVAFQTNTTTVIFILNAAISLTNNTIPSGSDTQTVGIYPTQGDVPGNAAVNIINLMPCRQTLSATTTVYLVANAHIGVSTMAGWGWISARRC